MEWVGVLRSSGVVVATCCGRVRGPPKAPVASTTHPTIIRTNLPQWIREWALRVEFITFGGVGSFDIGWVRGFMRPMEMFSPRYYLVDSWRSDVPLGRSYARWQRRDGMSPVWSILCRLSSMLIRRVLLSTTALLNRCPHQNNHLI